MTRAGASTRRCRETRRDELAKIKLREARRKAVGGVVAPDRKGRRYPFPKSGHRASTDRASRLNGGTVTAAPGARLRMLPN